MKKFRLRLRQNTGFSLAETLMAVLILSMVTGIVAVGVPAATRAYRNAIDASHAQVLLSTTMTALRDELSTSKITKVDGKTIKYTDENGIKSQITVEGKNENERIYLYKAKTNVGDSEPSWDTGANKRLLISDKAATSNMYAKYTSVESVPSDSEPISIVKIKGLCVMRGNNPISDLGDTGDYEISIIGIEN